MHKTNHTIHWTVIYLVDSTVHLFEQPRLGRTTILLNIPSYKCLSSIFSLEQSQLQASAFPQAGNPNVLYTLLIPEP